MWLGFILTYGILMTGMNKNLTKKVLKTNIILKTNKIMLDQIKRSAKILTVRK